VGLRLNFNPKPKLERGEVLSNLDLSISKSDFFKYLVEQIKIRKLNLFLGAGISKNAPSNLPLASEFRRFVLHELCSTEGMTEIYDKYADILAELPFESFVKLLMTDSNFFDYHLSIFSSGKPNKNHLLIAKLMAKGLITETLTTNFDMLLEQGAELHPEGAHALSVLLDEKQFQQVNFENMKKLVLFKIHGGVQYPQSIRVTLDLISSQSLQKDRIKVLDHFFNKSGKDLLILGYSCSDDFDINPYLQNLKSKTTVLFVKHTNSGFRIEHLADPLNALSGYQIICNTDEIVDYLWKEYSDLEFKNPDKNEQKWMKAVQKWNKELNPAQRCYLIGNVLLELRKVDVTINLFERGLDRNPDRRLRAHILTRLGTAQNLKGNYEDAFQSYEESLSLLEEGKNDLKIAEVHHFLGMLEKLRCNYSASEEHLMNSKKLSEKSGCSLGVSIVTAEIGTLYQRKGNYIKAKMLYEEALSIDRKIGHLVGIAVCLHHLGTIARNQKDTKQAEALFKEELDLRNKLGDKQGIAGAKHELGLCARDKGRLDEAQELLEEAKCILERLPDSARIAWTLHDLGTVHYLKGNLELSEDLTQKSIAIKRQKMIFGD
jgi:tetratricopeptide (TPR) repeat protein